jgi:hypothetical protein
MFSFAAYSIFSRKSNDEKDSDAPSPPPRSTSEQSSSFGKPTKDTKEVKSHPFALDADEVASTAIAVVHASSLRSNCRSLAGCNVLSVIYPTFFDYIFAPARMMRHSAFVIFCRLHILRAAIAMLIEFDSVFAMSPLSYLPDSTLVAAASLLDACYTVLGHNPEIFCPIIATVLLALEAVLCRASSARFTAPLVLLEPYSSTYLSPVPEVLLLEHYPTVGATEEASLAPASSSSSSSSPSLENVPTVSCPASYSNATTNEDLSSDVRCLDDCKNDFYYLDVLSVAVAVTRESVIAGNMNFFCAQQSLLDASRANTQVVIEYATENADFMTPANLAGLKSDLLAIDANLAALASRLYVEDAENVAPSFETALVVQEKMHLISSVFTIQNVALGEMPLDGKTRADLLSSCVNTGNFLAAFAARLDAGDARFWGTGAKVVFGSIGVHAVNPMIDIENNWPHWFYENDSEDLMQAADKIRKAWEDIQSRYKNGHPRASNFERTTPFAPSDINSVSASTVVFNVDHGVDSMNTNGSKNHFSASAPETSISGIKPSSKGC